MRLSAKVVLVELEDWEENPAHNPTAVEEMFMASATFLEELKDIFEDLMDLLENLFPVPQYLQYSMSFQHPLSLQNTCPTSLSHLLKQPVPQPCLR